MALRDEEEAPNDNAVAGSTVGPLTTRTKDPLPPSDSPEEHEAECSEDAAGAAVTLAANAASTSDLPASLVNEAGGRMERPQLSPIGYTWHLFS